MINTILTKIIGTKNERELKAHRSAHPADHRARAVRRFPLSDDQLQAKTDEFRARLKGGGGDGGGGESLDDLLPEAFAVVREAGRRVLNMRHFDVQLIGGLALHRGMIAEMKTGEGKTLVATLAAYLNALPGKGVHVVTVNDYLAKRDSEWMGRIFRFLGLTVGVIQHNLDDARAPGGLRRRHHLRHQQRVRLRLPARQHEVRAQQLRPARAQLRGRGRGGLDPDRRGAHAAHHQRPRRGVDGQVLPDQRHHPQAQPGRAHQRGHEGGGAGGAGEDGRLHRRREGQDGHPHRDGDGARGEAARGAEPLGPVQHGHPPPREPGAARAHPVPARRGLRGERRARSSSSTSSPGASCPAGAGRTACTRRWRPRRRSRSSARTRPSPPSPSRTTSACTRSSRA